MVTVDDVRDFAATLPRACEAVVRDRVKFRVGHIVFLAFSRDESTMGFAFPKEERDALIASEPNKYGMPSPSDLRYHWVVVKLAAIDQREMREIVLEAWRMVVPKKVAAGYEAAGGFEIGGTDMSAKTDRPGNDAEASAEIDAIISGFGGWRSTTASGLRSSIRAADRSIVEEVKWRKPSRPEGVPVWSHDGIVCVGEALKSAVRLTFPKGASLKDPKKLFNARLDSKTVRAIDVHEGDKVNEAALKRLIVEAVALNGAKKGT